MLRCASKAPRQIEGDVRALNKLPRAKIGAVFAVRSAENVTKVNWRKKIGDVN